MRKFLTLVAPLLLGFIIAFSWLNYQYGTKVTTNFADFALGYETQVYQPQLDGQSLHAINEFSQFNAVVKGWESRGKKRAVLWLGNSQLHAINQLKNGAKNSVEFLHNSLQPKDLDVIGFSLPNASLQEHYVMYEYAVDKMPVDYLILPIFFDDLREDDIRAQLFDVAVSESCKANVRESSVGDKAQKVFTEANTGSVTSATQNNDYAALKETTQDRVERGINNWLSAKSIIWEQRADARSGVLTKLFILRNTVFGIKPTSKRKMIKARYDANLRAFDDLIKAARKRNTKVIIYVPPIRHDVEVPYDVAEYNNFKETLSKLSQEKGAYFVNLDDLVPPQYWGTKDSTTFGGATEIDFMHFQATGHKLLADALLEFVQQNKIIVTD